MNGKFEGTAAQRKDKPKKKIGTMDLVLIVIAVALTAFTVSMICTFRETGMVPDTLITCVFTSLGGECGAMAWIKTTKERVRERNWELEDRAAAKAEKELEQQQNDHGGQEHAHTELYL